MKTQLNVISDIQLGYQARKGIKTSPSGSHLLIQARDIKKALKIEWETLTRFEPSGSTERYEVQQGDILLLARGHENFAYLLEDEVIATIPANSFYIIRPDRNIVSSKYLTWWINQSPAQEYFRYHRSGSAIPLITVSNLLKLEVNIPPPEIQKQITELVELLEKEKKLTQLYLEKKTTLIEGLCLHSISKKENIHHD